MGGRGLGLRGTKVLVVDDVVTAHDGSEGLRGWTSIPIIVLSARTDSGDKVPALDAGADDCVTKPFGMDELPTRLRAAIRRSAVPPGAGEQAVVETDSFTVDLAATKVHRDGAEVHLAQLRRKLEPLPSRPRHLGTEAGMGHRFEL